MLFNLIGRKKNITNEEFEKLKNGKFDEIIFSKEKYREWFDNFFKELENSNPTLEEIIKRLEEANRVSLGFYLKMNKIDDENNAPLNGLYTDIELKEKLYNLIDSEELIKKIEEKLNDEDNDNDSKIDNSKDKEDELFNKIASLIISLSEKLTFDEEKGKISSDKKEAIMNKYMATLKEKKFSNTKIDILAKKILNKEKIKDAQKEEKKKNEESINPYKEANIYYYFMIYVKIMKALSPFRAKSDNLLKYEQKALELIDLYLQDGFFEYKNDNLDELVANFNEKYNTNLNTDILLTVIKRIDEKSENKIEDYNSIYKTMFKSAFIQSKDDIDDLSKPLMDFERICKNIITNECSNIKYKDVQFGAMDKSERKEYAKDLLEETTNLTKQAITELNTELKDVKNADSNALLDVSKKKIEEVIYDETGNDLKEKFEKIRKAAAIYKTVEDIHNSRGLGFKIFKHSKYKNEEKTLNELKDIMQGKESTKEQQEERNKFINELLEEKTIYKASFRTSINNIMDIDKLMEESQELIPNDEVDVINLKNEVSNVSEILYNEKEEELDLSIKK